MATPHRQPLRRGAGWNQRRETPVNQNGRRHPMKALQYVEIGEPPQIREVPTPEPGPGQVRLKVTAAGACHSDSFVMSLDEEQYTASYPLPMTLGHEGAGIVDKLGEGVTEVTVGDSVAVYGPWGCGRCYQCAQGKENYCERAAELGITPPGLGHDGSMAEYMIVGLGAAPRAARRPRSGGQRRAHRRGPHAVPRDQGIPPEACSRNGRRRHRNRRPRPRRDPDSACDDLCDGHRARCRREEARACAGRRGAPRVPLERRRRRRHS